MICPKCGANVENGTKFCSECGTDVTIQPAPQPQSAPQPQPVPAYAQNTYQPQPQAQPQVQYAAPQPAYRPIPPAPQYVQPAYQQQANMYANNAPMSVGQYILTFIISAIPLVGFIMLLVWAFGSSTNKNKKNFARAVLILGIISGVIYAIIAIIMVVAGASLFSSMSNYSTY